MAPILVFSDMDGTLLDHFDYSFDAAKPALQRLRDAGIPLILNTSKTFEELLVWQARLGSDASFIVENGAAAYFPVSGVLNLAASQNGADSDGLMLEATNRFSVLEMSMGRPEILAFLHELRETAGYDFEGFADLSVQQLCDITGLSQVDAHCALNRGYSEPLCWHDTESHWKAFVLQLQAAGLQVLKGGRFNHIMGQTDKGRAMLKVAQLLSPDETPICIALGDSGNDIAMLQVADIGVVVRSPVHEPPVVPQPRGKIVITEADGPAGWNQSMMTILDELGV